MTILGIDTSLRSSGYGVLVTEGSRMRSPEAGRIRNAQKLPLSECLRAIHARVAELIAQYSPDVVAIESVIYGKNAGTMLVLGEARGAVITAAADAGLPIYEYEPRRVKMAVCRRTAHLRVRAAPREDGGVRQRPCREGAGTAHGEDAPRAGGASSERRGGRACDRHHARALELAA